MSVPYRELTTLGDLVSRGAVRVPERTALVVSDQRATYAELERRTRDIARSLVGLGVGLGDRVALLMPNSLLFLEVLFACARIGAVAVPINARFRSVELRHVVPDAGAKVLVTSDLVEDAVSFADRIVEAFPDVADGEGSLERPLSIGAAPVLQHVVMLGDTERAGFLSRQAFVDAGRDVDAARVDAAGDRVSLRDPAIIFYTSGTTALPKGCTLSHEAVSRQGLDTARRQGYRDGDVLFSPLPMFHTGCTQALIAVLQVDGTYLSMTRVDGEQGLRMLVEERATLMFTAFPAITEGVLGAAGYAPELLRDVRVLFHIGTPDQLRGLQARVPATTKVITGFGMTEFAGSVCVGDPDDPIEHRVHPGRPLAGAEFLVRDLASGSPAEPGVDGELFARGPTVFSGYHGRTDLTEAAFDPEGWYRTGDLGMVDENGLLRFRGRLKDMLKIGGENVGAIEIESHLESHPDILLASVVGVPDERLGEVAVAFVELRAGADLSAADVIAHCDGAIASFKVPRYVRFVTEWPMSATKIAKDPLRERILNELGTDEQPLGATPS